MGKRWKGFWSIYDWLSRIDFANTLAGGLFDYRMWIISIVGSFMIYIWGAIKGWDVLTLVIACILVAACISLIYLAVRSFLDDLHRKQPVATEPPPAAKKEETSRFGDLSRVALRKIAIEYAASWRIFEANAVQNEPQPRYLIPPRTNDSDELTRFRERQKNQITENDRARNRYNLEIEIQFRNSHLPDARELFAELDDRLRKEGILNPYIATSATASINYGMLNLQEGTLNGPRPITAIADYIEVLARKLAV